MPPHKPRSLLLRALFAASVVLASGMALPAAAELRLEPAPPCDEDVAPPCPPAKDRPPSWFPKISGNGRYLVFYSAHHLVADGNAGGLFRLDRSTGAVHRVNVDSLGRVLTRYTFSTAISHDGDRVAFSAVDWGAPLEDPPQIWVREFSTGRTILASATVAGLPSGGRVDANPTISADGRFAGFSGPNGDLVAGDRQNSSREAYVRDLTLGVTTRVSTGPAGLSQSTDASAPRISAGGRYVSFSAQTPLVAGLAGTERSVYLRDMQTGRLDLVSQNPNGGLLYSADPYGMSDDGTQILMLGAPDKTTVALYVRDRLVNETRLLMGVSDLGTAFGELLSLSGDGNVAALQTRTPVGLRDTDGREDILLVDTRTGATRATTPDTMLDQPDAPVLDPALSYDGNVLVTTTSWRNQDQTDPCCTSTIDKNEIYTYTASTGEWQQITPRTPFPPIPVLPPVPAPLPSVPGGASGYWMLGEAGDVYAFGAAGRFGNGKARSIDIEATPANDGYWILDRDGRVTALGAAPALGNATVRAGEQATSLSATTTGRGYWVFTDAGRVLTVGDAVFYGDMSGTRLNGPVLGSVVTPSGRGYWMVASDGGIFSFGDARFHGSMGGRQLNKPIVSMAPDPDGSGYWLVASDGGIFAFDAPFYGSMGATRLNKPVTGMVTGRAGYLMVATDGGIFAFGDVPFAGSLGATPPPHPIVAVALKR